MKISLSIFFLAFCAVAAAQTNLTISGQTYTNSSDTWTGVNIPRSAPTLLIFKNNTITSDNRFGYLLQAGDESPASTNNNLDGAVITGNRLNWKGTDMEVITHGIFTGHNKNVIIKYNYLNYVPMGIIRKSGNNMSNTGGGVAYNIVKGGAVGLVVKGMSNVNVLNNTFYTDREPVHTWRPLLYIYTNTDQGKYSVAHGTKVYNNIFYTKYRTPVITVLENESLNGFECDYNLYWSEAGPPLFVIEGVELSFAQWQARGYDIHSVVRNPNFRDLTGFVPASRINSGRDLGPEWSEGLSVSAKWGSGDPATTSQNGPWQIGAVVHGTEGGETGAFEILQSVLTDKSPTVIEITFTEDLSSVNPATTDFRVNVNSSQRTVETVSVSGNKLLLTISGPLSHTDRITIDYIKPSSNPLSSSSGEQLSAFSNYAVINNIHSGKAEINIYPNPVIRHFNISNTGPDQLPQIIRIYDMAGRLCYEKKLETEFLYKVPVNLAPGIYILYLALGTDTEYSQKLIVVE
ncbi:MAG: T9SS type A sorting domain-containing protein [Chloroflexota bacterium]